MHRLASPILIVEDNPLDLDLAMRAFSRRKVSNPIVVARDGEEAINLIPRWESGEPVPAVILLDLKLPRIDGLDVLRALKAHERFRLIPIIVLTSSAEDRDISEAYKLGVNSYIVKPVDFNRFSEVCAQLEMYWFLLNTPPREV